jgi:putative iron-only hydrogenase system regulator
MESRIAVIGIIVEDTESADMLNDILHEFGEYIIGRMGVPYRARGINVISVAMDAPANEISALAGKIGNLDGVSAKTAYSSVSFSE